MASTSTPSNSMAASNPKNANDELFRNQFNDIAARYRSNPLSAKAEIKRALQIPDLYPYYIALYRLLRLTTLLVTPGESLSKRVLDEARYSLMVIHIPDPADASPAEKHDIRELLLSGYGILTCLGDTTIIDTWEVGEGLIGRLWNSINTDKSDAIGFAHRLLSAHTRFVLADSKLLKGEYQMSKAGVEARKTEYRERDWRRGGEAEEREHPGRYTGRAGWVRHSKILEDGEVEEPKKRRSRSKSAVRERKAEKKRSASASAA